MQRNYRQYKKLCKKAASILQFEDCEKEEGIWYIFWDCSGADHREFDGQPCWDWLVARFQGEVNTFLDSNNELGISWKPSHLCLPSTPSNVFKWAMKTFPTKSAIL